MSSITFTPCANSHGGMPSSPYCFATSSFTSAVAWMVSTSAVIPSYPSPRPARRVAS